MSHLLIIDLPGGNDPDILCAALNAGHSFTFLTADAAHYRSQAEISALLDQARAVIEARDFSVAAVLPLLAGECVDAVLCLQDLRIVEAALIARALGLPHLDPQTAALCRDKSAVRAVLARAGLAGADFARVSGTAPLLAAVERLGLPLIIKPIDGFGSQHVFALRTPADLDCLARLADLVAAGPGQYGLGVAASPALLVERLHEGSVIGCDTMSANGRHCLLGVNEKLFVPPPSFAIRGGCFTTNTGQFARIEAFVFALLDAVGFNHGAAHVELALTADGPRLIELNPRLVGARIASLISAARDRSVHDDLVALHVRQQLPPPASRTRHAVTRWLMAPRSGTLQAVSTSGAPDPARSRLLILARPGDHVRPPLDNADRIGCAMTYGAGRPGLEALAERMIADCCIRLEQPAPAGP